MGIGGASPPAMRKASALPSAEYQYRERRHVPVRSPPAQRHFVASTSCLFVLTNVSMWYTMVALRWRWMSVATQVSHPDPCSVSFQSAQCEEVHRPSDGAGQGLVAAEPHAGRVAFAGIYQLDHCPVQCATRPGGSDGTGSPLVQTGSSSSVHGAG